MPVMPIPLLYPAILYKPILFVSTHSMFYQYLYPFRMLWHIKPSPFTTPDTLYIFAPNANNYCFYHKKVTHSYEVNYEYPYEGINMVVDLQLEAGQRVWLRPNSITAMYGKDGNELRSWFSGHLVYAL